MRGGLRLEPYVASGSNHSLSLILLVLVGGGGGGGGGGAKGGLAAVLVLLSSGTGHSVGACPLLPGLHEPAFTHAAGLCCIHTAVAPSYARRTLLAVALDRRLASFSDSAAACSRVPSG